MLNIPTELLRTLVSVVDQRSFTKAAHSLGVTQPAVSAQIKRLQFLLGYEILDKSAPGVSLTPRGEMVVAHARRMLSVNDQIAQLSGGQPTAQTVRVAIPGDFAGVKIPATLAQFRKRWPDIRFVATATSFENMLRGLRQGDIDLAVAVANSKPSIEAHHLWIDQAVWVRIDATDPIAAFSDDLVSKRDDRIKRREYARLDASIVAPNRIEVRSDRVQRYSLFLNEQLIDFSKPLVVRTNGQMSFEGSVTPSLETLLREARLRHDSRQLFPVHIVLQVRKQPS